LNTTASTRLARLSELFLAYAPWIAAVTLAVALERACRLNTVLGAQPASYA